MNNYMFNNYAYTCIMTNSQLWSHQFSALWMMMMIDCMIIPA